MRLNYDLAGKIIYLAETADPRAVPLLRRALAFRNYMIAIMAAKGLAVIQDNDSIPFIIDACRKAPSDAAIAIADSLIYFDDPERRAQPVTICPKNILKLCGKERCATAPSLIGEVGGAYCPPV